MTLGEWVDAWAGVDRTAIHFDDATVTYDALAQRVLRSAAALSAAGVEPGDRVGFAGLNRVEVFENLFACARLGAVFVPYNNRLTAAELAVQIADSDPKVLLATDGFHALLEEAAGERPVLDLDATPLDAPLQTTSATVAEDDVVLMVYTSGTTGVAKGAMLTHRNIDFTVRNGIDHQGLSEADRIVAPLPTFHVGGLNIQTLPVLRVGGEVVLLRRFDPADVLDAIERRRATQTLLVPAMLTAVSGLPNFGSADLSSLVGVNSGSSVVPLEVMRPFFDRGIPVGQVYGTTETGPTAVVLDYADGQRHVGSCGKPATHTEVRIVDPDGVDVVEGEPGELLVRGPNVFVGYWSNPVATAAAFDGDWFRTGDVGYRDPQGFLHISDRIKDVVISGGENVYPAELEPVLAEHPAIAEVAVIGRADDRWGEVPVAVVVLTPGHVTLDIDELRSWCGERLARFKQPRAVEIVETLPRTALGKVQKHLLRSSPQ